MCILAVCHMHKLSLRFLCTDEVAYMNLTLLHWMLQLVGDLNIYSLFLRTGGDLVDILFARIIMF